MIRYVQTTASIVESYMYIILILRMDLPFIHCGSVFEFLYLVDARDLDLNLVAFMPVHLSLISSLIAKIGSPSSSKLFFNALICPSEFK